MGGISKKEIGDTPKGRCHYSLRGLKLRMMGKSYNPTILQSESESESEILRSDHPTFPRGSMTLCPTSQRPNLFPFALNTRRSQEPANRRSQTVSSIGDVDILRFDALLRCSGILSPFINKTLCGLFTGLDAGPLHLQPDLCWRPFFGIGDRTSRGRDADLSSPNGRASHGIMSKDFLKPAAFWGGGGPNGGAEWSNRTPPPIEIRTIKCFCAKSPQHKEKTLDVCVTEFKIKRTQL